MRCVFFMRSISASAVPTAGVQNPNDYRQEYREKGFRGTESGDVQINWS